MMGSGMKRELGMVLLFGLLLVTLSYIRFDIPGAIGVQSNFSEVAVLASLLFVRHWVSALAVAAFAVFTASSPHSPIPETANHVLGMVFLYVAYQRTLRLSNPYAYAAALVGMVLVYYYVFLIPVIFLGHFLLGNIALDEALRLIPETNKGIVFEWATTTVVSVLLFFVHREYVSRLAAQEETLRVNAVLAENLAALQKVAYVDPPTGLPNGLQLERDIQQLMASNYLGEKRCVVMGGFSIEGLASLTHEIGFERASKVYTSISERFVDALTSQDHGTGHYRLPYPIKRCYRVDASIVVFLLHLPQGVEEFSVLMQGNPLKSTLQSELERNNLQTPLSFRGGVSFYPDDTDSLPQLLHNLLNMLHSDITRNRGDFVAFNPAQYKKHLRTEQLRQCMATGLKANEFYPVFQPKIDARSQTLYGYEALARWNSASLGNISPVEFIEVAEKYQFIEALTKHQLQGVLAFLRTLRTTQAHVGRVAINISADLLTPEFFSYLLNEVEEALYPHLEIEITESMVPVMTDQIVASFRRLKQAGVTTAIDDFGTGYSNLVSLQNFEPDVLKIDKSFVDGVPGNPKSCKLVKAVLDIAKELEVRVVAEGVETQAQADFLLENGCTIMQGYLFSKPLAAAAASEFTLGTPA